MVKKPSEFLFFQLFQIFSVPDRGSLVSAEHNGREKAAARNPNGKF